MRYFAPIFVGTLLIAIGIYFFPLGQDVVYYALLDHADGEFWLAWAYLYVICLCFILVGYMVIKQGYAGLRSPITLGAVIVTGVVVFGFGG